MATHSRGSQTSRAADWLIVLDVARGERLGDEVRFVSCVELVAEVLDVTFHGSRRDPQFLRALLRRKPAGDAL